MKLLQSLKQKRHSIYRPYFNLLTTLTIHIYLVFYFCNAFAMTADQVEVDVPEKKNHIASKTNTSSVISSALLKVLNAFDRDTEERLSSQKTDETNQQQNPSSASSRRWITTNTKDTREYSKLPRSPRHTNDSWEVINLSPPVDTHLHDGKAKPLKEITQIALHEQFILPKKINRADARGYGKERSTSSDLEMKEMVYSLDG